MKKLFFLAIIFFLFTELVKAYDQNTIKSKRHSLGIGFMKYSFAQPNHNVFMFPFVRATSKKDGYAENSFLLYPELYYSYQLGAQKIRGSFFITDDRSKYSPYLGQTIHRQTKFNLGLGIQQDVFEYKNWTPYLFFDLFVTYTKSEEEVFSYPGLIIDPIIKPSEPKLFEFNGRLGLGMNILFNKQKYSASVESAFRIRDETFYPLSCLSFNYHF